jgi:outer membrane protein
MTWLGVLVLAAVPDTGVRAVTLDEALELARQYALQSVQTQGQLTTSAAAVRSAYASFLPSVSLSSGATRQFPSGGGGTRVENGQVITVPDEPWSYSGSLSANIEVFGGGRRFFELSQAKADRRAGEAGSIAGRYDVALAVKQQFYNVLAARESEIAAEAQVEQAEQQLRTAIARVRNQAATRSDSLRSEIQLRNARLAVLDARNSLAIANASLTRAVGTPYALTATADALAALALEPGAAELMRMAQEGPGVHAARAQLDAAIATRRISWTGYLPSVNASYSRAASGTDQTFGFGTEDYSYSGSFRLSLSLPLFNQLQREEQVVRARAGVDNAKAALRDAQLAATLEMTQAVGAWQLGTERVAAHTASVEAAEEDLRVQQQRYTAGGSTLLDVLTSQTQLNQARQDLIRARYDQRVARAQIEAIAGADL